MASTIVTKNSSTASAVPLTGDLTQGELAVNVTDKRLFTKDSGGTVVEVGTNPTSMTIKTTLKLSGSTSGYVALQGAAAAGSTTYTLPSADGTSGQALTTNGSGTLSWATIAASAATATALGTVYGKMTTSGASPYLTALGYNAGVSTTGAGVTAVGQEAAYTNSSGTQNVAMGYQALYSNSTNSFSTAIGYQALKTATGGQNTAVGRTSLQALTTGTGNTALGVNSLYTSTTSANSVAVGDNALFATTTGSYNVAVGQAALQNNTTASNNTAVGYQALFSNTTSSYSTCVGYQAGYSSNSADNIDAFGFGALYANTTGQQNAAIGMQSLAANTTGNYNVAVGKKSMYLNTTGSSNVAMGVQSLYSNTTSNYNTAIGQYALFSNTTVGENTAVGYGALYSNTTGPRNTCVGTSAGYSVTTGNDNVFVGYNAGQYSSPTTTGGGNVILGAYARASAAGDQLCIVMGRDATGKGSSTGFINPNGGGVYQGNNSSSWSTTSDRRLKKNIVDNNIGLEKLVQIQVRNFEYRLPEEVDPELSPTDAIKKQGVQLGVIAQELQQVFPDCVKQESTGVLSVDPDNLTWYTINAIKQLKAELDAAKAEIATLKGN